MEKLIYKIIKELKAKISDKYELHEIRIFGSTARGDRRLDSDIDVFVRLSQVNRQIEEDLFDIAYELELKNDCLVRSNRFYQGSRSTQLKSDGIDRCVYNFKFRIMFRVFQRDFKGN